MPPSSGNDDALATDLAITGQVLADDVDVIEASIANRQDCRVTNAPWLEAAEFGPLQSECGVHGRSCDHIRQRHAETEEFRHGGDLVERRSVYTERVHVGRDRVWQEAISEHGARGLKCERALAVADIEEHAALARFDD